MNILDEIIESQSTDADTLHQYDLIVKRALQEKLTDLEFVLSTSTALQEHGIRCERDGGSVVVSGMGGELARWSCDRVMLRLTWAGPDLTALSTKDAVRLTAHVLSERLAVVKPKPAAVAPVPVASPVGSRGWQFAAARPQT